MENGKLQVAKVTNLQAEVLRDTVAAGAGMVLPYPNGFWDGGRNAFAEIAAAVVHIKLVMKKATVYRSQDDKLTENIYPNLPK